MYYFERTIFGDGPLKKFLKRLWRQSIQTLRGDHAAPKENASFWNIFGQHRVFQVLWESLEIQFGRPKKNVDKNLGFFFNFAPPPPRDRENPKSAP